MTVWQLDLASFASVKAFAERFEREGGGRLDLLLLNAAVELPVFEQTKDGWETAYVKKPPYQSLRLIVI
jgi:NAD(P)-dependent dehydrogenase (short-subunit alcohol dehydrogenase family)